MKKNVAGQVIGAQMITAADGSAFTGSVTAYITGDGGTQAVGSVGSGAATHEGNGYHTYAPAQAETNYDLVAVTFIGTGAIPATIQVYTNFPQTVDNATNISAIKTKTDYLPSATAGSAGGVFIAGTNAATTVTTSFTTTFTGNLTGSVGSVTAGVTVTTNNDKTGYALSTAGIDGIWDEAAATHLTSGTMGLYLALSGGILVDTTITGTPSTTSLQLTAGSTLDDFYNDQLIYIISGTGLGQARPVLGYTGATKTLTVDEPWITTPAAADRIVIISTHVHPKSQITADIDANSTQLAAIIADTADMQPKLGIPAADISADIAAVKIDTAATLVDTGTTLPALIDSLSIKKNTAFNNFEFLMVLTSDHVTPATGLTVTGERSIDGGAFASVAGTIAEVSNGIYQFDALAADTNGDVITWRFSSATADDAFFTFKTVT